MDYGVTSFDSEWEVGMDLTVSLSSSDQNSSADDLPRNHPQSGPESIFGFGCSFGSGFGPGISRVNRNIVNETDGTSSIY